MLFPAGGYSTSSASMSSAPIPSPSSVVRHRMRSTWRRPPARKGSTWPPRRRSASPGTRASRAAASRARSARSSRHLGQGLRPPGLTEIAAWGFECDAQVGNVHVHEDYVYPEVLDLETGQPGPGERGEPGVYQPLPQGDAPAALSHARRGGARGRALPLRPHADGPQGRRDWPTGRHEKVRGVIVYPSRVEELVRQHAGIDEFRIVFRRGRPGRHPRPPRPRAGSGRCRRGRFARGGGARPAAWSRDPYLRRAGRIGQPAPLGPQGASDRGPAGTEVPLSAEGSPTLAEHDRFDHLKAHANACAYYRLIGFEVVEASEGYARLRIRCGKSCFSSRTRSTVERSSRWPTRQWR